MNKEKISFGKRLKEIMYEKRTTQKDLASKLGVDQTMISHWMTGKRNPNLNTIKRISKALNIPIIELMDEDFRSEAKDKKLILKIKESEKKIKELEEKLKFKDEQIAFLKEKLNFYEKKK